MILDTPDQIVMFAWLQIYHKLKLEVDRPGGPKWRDSPMLQAKAIMLRNGQRCNAARKAKVLAAYETFLKERGVLL